MKVSRKRAVLAYLSWFSGFEFSVTHLNVNRFVARDELYKTYMLHSHAVDGRRLQVVAGVSVRKTAAFSQILAT